MLLRRLRDEEGISPVEVRAECIVVQLSYVGSSREGLPHCTTLVACCSKSTKERMPVIWLSFSLTKY